MHSGKCHQCMLELQRLKISMTSESKKGLPRKERATHDRKENTTYHNNGAEGGLGGVILYLNKLILRPLRHVDLHSQIQ